MIDVLVVIALVCAAIIGVTIVAIILFCVWAICYVVYCAITGKEPPFEYQKLYDSKDEESK